jgi:hypothetical protein
MLHFLLWLVVIIGLVLLACLSYLWMTCKLWGIEDFLVDFWESEMQDQP